MSDRSGRVQLRREHGDQPAATHAARVVDPRIQARLEIQRTDDPREREADRMAALAEEELTEDGTSAVPLGELEDERRPTPGSSASLQRSTDTSEQERRDIPMRLPAHQFSTLSVAPPAGSIQRPAGLRSIGSTAPVALERASTGTPNAEPGSSVEREDVEAPEDAAGNAAGTAQATADRKRSSSPATHQHVAAADATDIVAQGTASGGSPLAPAMRRSMERGFGHDFATVRIHADGAADASAASVQARAYTVGHDIVFRAGHYAPGTTEGRGLLAHELAHTIQQGSSPILQRAPDAPSADPTGPGTPTSAPQAPPVQKPAIPDAPKPTGTSDERALVDKALASKNPGDVKAITNVNAATEEEKLELIRILTKQTWVGIRDEWKLEEIWRSFGERLPEVAGKNLLLWQDSINGGADVMKLPAVQKILIDYMNDVKQLAMSYLDKNHAYIISEKEKLGVGVAQPTAEQDKQLKLVQNAAVNVKKAMQQQAQLKLIHVGYSLLGTEKGSTTGSPAIPTWAQKRFDPNEPPQANLDKDEKDKLRDYNKVKTYWDPEQAYIDQMAAQYPAIYSALQNQEDSSIWQTQDPLTNTAGPIYGLAASADPATARSVIGQSLNQTQTLIEGARVKIMSDKPAYRDLTPLNSQLMAGMAPSLFSNRVWRDPFNKWIVERDLKEQHDAEFYKQLGVNALTAAAFAFVELASAGTATFFVVSAAGGAFLGGNALESVDKFTQLSNAARTNVSDSTRIVDKAAVHEAGAKAMQDVATFLVFVARVGIKAVNAALTGTDAPPAIASPSDDARTGKAPDDAQWKWKDVQGYLELTEDGRRALEVAQRNKVTLKYGEPGEYQTYHTPPPAGNRSGGTIVISRAKNSQSAALSFIHEMGHNEYYHTGGSATKQIREVGRDTYIGSKIMEEAMVKSREVRAKNEMNRFGEFPSTAGGPGTEQAYNKALGTRMRELRAQNNNYSEAYLHQQGHIAGENAVFDEYMKGNIRSSVPARVFENGQWVEKQNPTYMDYYGASWDRANQPPQRP